MFNPQTAMDLKLHLRDPLALHFWLSAEASPADLFHLPRPINRELLNFHESRVLSEAIAG